MRKMSDQKLKQDKKKKHWDGNFDDIVMVK